MFSPSYLLMISWFLTLCSTYFIPSWSNLILSVLGSLYTFFTSLLLNISKSISPHCNQSHLLEYRPDQVSPPGCKALQGPAPCLPIPPHPTPPWFLLHLPLLAFRHSSFPSVQRTYWPHAHLRTFALAVPLPGKFFPHLFIQLADSSSSFYLFWDFGKSCKTRSWVLLTFDGWQCFLHLWIVKLDQLSLGGGWLWRPGLRIPRRKV